MPSMKKPSAPILCNVASNPFFLRRIADYVTSSMWDYTRGGACWEAPRYIPAQSNLQNDSLDIRSPWLFFKGAE